MKTSTALRQEIMICMKANRIPVDGETWLKLVFMKRLALLKLCRELNIATK